MEKRLDILAKRILERMEKIYEETDKYEPFFSYDDEEYENIIKEEVELFIIEGYTLI